MIINTYLEKKYVFTPIDTNYENSAGGNKNKKDSKNLEEDHVYLSEKKEKVNEKIIDNVLISKDVIEQILFLAVNGGVRLKNVHNNVGCHVNATV